ncbi:hypothetical protein OOK13_13000 [Streptomyces sp. NBC_00378]|nr:MULTISPECIES: hypothetical protein [unclassified Streptomyces]MCX5109434.1 hypothetical protein [Streptomyces sp. NBC_00378]
MERQPQSSPGKEFGRAGVVELPRRGAFEIACLGVIFVHRR